MAQGSPERARAVLATRLQARRPEIEQALQTRIHALASSGEALDPEYTDGLRVAVGAALDFGLAVVRAGPEGAPPIPAPLLTQVRLAARNGIGLDTVLRRYLAGYTLLNDFLLGEAAEEGLVGGRALPDLMRAQAGLFDRLLGEISEEYVREVESRPDSSAEQRRAERIEGLLAGELLDASGLGYEMEAVHLGLIAVGPEAERTLRDLAAPLDCRLLLVRQRRETVWAWIGARHGLDPATIDRLLSSGVPPGAALAIGEPARGLAGWRLTHRQAKAALTVVPSKPHAPIRYADVALLASMLQDDMLTTSLSELYLEPLTGERDGGAVARETLRAYFAAGRNASSAAAALGVSRQAVTQRLRAIEERLSRPLGECASELEAALSMERFQSLRLSSTERQSMPHR